MFPTFDVPPQHAETVGARRARKTKEEQVTNRSSSTTSQSSGSTHGNVGNAKSSEKSGFAWFGKNRKKGVQEIPSRAVTKQSQLASERGPEPEPLGARLQALPEVQWMSYHPSDCDSVLPGSQHFPQSSHAKSLPLPPPTSVLPLPPSSGLTDWKSGCSSLLRVSTNLTNTTLSDRSTLSNQSASSVATGFDSSFSDGALVDSRYADNMHLEPVERGPRYGSRQGTPGSKYIKSPFVRAVAKMESASARIISARLSEEWDGLKDDQGHQEIIFEKRLWALIAYQRLTQNKQLQSPAHDILSSSRPADQRRLLLLNGPLADGWMLASHYPATTIYTLSSEKSSDVPTSYPAPLNHHSLYVPSVSMAAPFPDNYFDAIVSRSIATTLRNDDWARSFFDYMRVLKPGGQIEIISVDAHMSYEGPKLSSWVEKHVSSRLGAHDLSRQASDTVLDTMEIVGLEKVRRARVALPVHSPKAMIKPAPSSSHTSGTTVLAPYGQESNDSSIMMALLGRHFYQDIYGKLMSKGHNDGWFWTDRNIKDECEQYMTKMVLHIACAQKPALDVKGGSYLDI